MLVEVSVMDLNDNPPMFVNQPYHAVISKEAARDSQGREQLEIQFYLRLGIVPKQEVVWQICKTRSLANLPNKKLFGKFEKQEAIWQIC